MPPKHKTSLSDAVKATTAADADRVQEAIAAAPVKRPPRATPRSPSRVGTGLLGGYFPEDVRQEWKRLALDRGATSQSLLAEAINDLFQKYGKQRIADETRLR